jgi:hypothetical protein
MLPFTLTAQEGRLWANQSRRSPANTLRLPSAQIHGVAAVVSADVETGTADDVKTGESAALLFRG